MNEREPVSVEELVLILIEFPNVSALGLIKKAFALTDKEEKALLGKDYERVKYGR